MKRFGRGDEDVRRTARLALPVRGGSIAGANGRFQQGQRLSQASSRFNNAFQRHLEVAMDVVVESLQRRHVEDANASAWFLSPQLIQAGEECGQRLAGTGRG